MRIEPNPITCTPNTTNTSESTRAQLDYIHTSSGAASTSNAGRSQGGKNNPRDRGAPGRKRGLNGLSIRDNLIKTKHKKFHTFHLENI